MCTQSILIYENIEIHNETDRLINFEIENAENPLLNLIPKNNAKKDNIGYSKENDDHKDNVGNTETDKTDTSITPATA